MKLFRFIYTVFPTGDCGGDISPRQQQMVISASDEEEARRFFPRELLPWLVIVNEAEIKPGILFR